MSTDTEYQLRLGKIQYDRQETGSRNNYARIIDRNVISKANTMFSRAADTMDWRPTPNINFIYYKWNEIQYGRLETGSSNNLDFLVIWS